MINYWRSRLIDIVFATGCHYTVPPVYWDGMEEMLVQELGDDISQMYCYVDFTIENYDASSVKLMDW